MKIIGKIVKLKLKIEKLTTGKTEKLKSQVRQITVKSVKSPTPSKNVNSNSIIITTDYQLLLESEKLFQVLKGKKFLLLLDDVWENIDLQAIGIPDPSIENGCKIIMASRKRGSLETFFKQVGGIIDLPEIQPFARAIVEGCGGLPLLIIVTRRALAEETNISVWKYASSWKGTSAGLTEPPSEEEWRQAKMIFLMDNDLCTLTEKPNCPELSQLFMQRNSKLRVIRTSFFDLMTSLTVLNLSRNRIRSLPKTLFKLINLEILILRYCDCLHVLPSEVGFLERLEVLDLHGTEVIKLPEEIGKLASLIQLEVSLYGSIDYTEYVRLPQKLISNGIISKLHKLENLSIDVYPGDQRWYKVVSNNVKDLSSLLSFS
ncbi:disease resistance protein RPS2-like [Pistacia vera]|uniref:disease resistance protein RPS2-like n=1 Tax=Pistacia vera TaxID=55513 RepID=UPI001262D489|nr:disease resistance protein RPS2-like [Pistacia vera]